MLFTYILGKSEPILEFVALQVASCGVACSVLVSCVSLAVAAVFVSGGVTACDFALIIKIEVV